LANFLELTLMVGVILIVPVLSTVSTTTRSRECADI
jgi:hypothetical protein